MSVDVDSDIYDAFAKHLVEFAAGLSPPLPVALPGIHFTPPDEGLWLELAWFPGRTENYGTGNDGPSLHQGFGQVTACDRPGVGIVPVVALANAVIAWFAKGTDLSPGRVEQKPWMSSVLVADAKIVAPVTIRYKALVNG